MNWQKNAVFQKKNHICCNVLQTASTVNQHGIKHSMKNTKTSVRKQYAINYESYKEKYLSI